MDCACGPSGSGLPGIWNKASVQVISSVSTGIRGMSHFKASPAEVSISFPKAQLEETRIYSQGGASWLEGDSSKKSPLGSLVLEEP